MNTDLTAESRKKFPLVDPQMQALHSGLNTLAANLGRHVPKDVFSLSTTLADDKRMAISMMHVNDKGTHIHNWHVRSFWAGQVNVRAHHHSQLSHGWSSSGAGESDMTVDELKHTLFFHIIDDLPESARLRVAIAGLGALATANPNETNTKPDPAKSALVIN